MFRKCFEKTTKSVGLDLTNTVLKMFQRQTCADSINNKEKPNVVLKHKIDFMMTSDQAHEHLLQIENDQKQKVMSAQKKIDDRFRIQEENQKKKKRWY